jgi:hypothetical protein
MPTRPGQWDRLYDTARWKRIRQFQLRTHPWCAYCERRGVPEPAIIADHITPWTVTAAQLGGSEAAIKTAFYTSPLQSLCVNCHNKIKRSEERAGSGRSIACDIHGNPLDPAHPAHPLNDGRIPPRPPPRDPGLYPRFQPRSEADRDDDRQPDQSTEPTPATKPPVA